MAKIIIQRLKSLAFLEFEIPRQGVFVLTGINGSGKTKLLACLQRIVDRYAFQKHFRTSGSDQFDNYSASEITYKHNQQTVTYRYRNTRWQPNPWRNSSVLRNLGFSSSVFISSSGERFYVQNADLTTRGIIAASNFIKQSMNDIFQTTQYNELRRKKLDGRGRGEGRDNYGFLMPLQAIGGQSQYYTEKNFSLGEILVLNALYRLEYVANNSLILIDEVELALHPRIQVRFLRFLQRIALQKNLTVILSTHSSSLIKSAPKLIHIERDPGTGIANVIEDCYPAVVLQNVAVTEEVQPDVLFFVEDDYAKYILEHLLNFYFKFLNNDRRPIIKILPVGGWVQTVRLAVSSTGYLIPNATSVFAVLDADVAPEIQTIQQNANRSAAEQENLNLHNNHQQMISYLPVTPELGIVNLLTTNPAAHIQPLQDLYSEVFDISQIINDESQRGLQYPPNARREAKMRITYYIECIHNFTNRDLNYIRSKLCEYFANTYCPANNAALQQLFGPKFLNGFVSL